MSDLPRDALNMCCRCAELIGFVGIRDNVQKGQIVDIRFADMALSVSGGLHAKILFDEVGDLQHGQLQFLCDVQYAHPGFVFLAHPPLQRVLVWVAGRDGSGG